MVVDFEPDASAWPGSAILRLTSVRTPSARAWGTRRANSGAGRRSAITASASTAAATTAAAANHRSCAP